MIFLAKCRWSDLGFCHGLCLPFTSPSLLFSLCLLDLNRSPYLTVVLLFIPAALGQQLPLGRPLSSRPCVGTCSCHFCGHQGYCSSVHGTLHAVHHHLHHQKPLTIPQQKTLYHALTWMYCLSQNDPLCVYCGAIISL